MEKEKYIPTKMEIVEFDEEDIITNSDGIEYEEDELPLIGP